MALLAIGEAPLEAEQTGSRHRGREHDDECDRQAEHVAERSRGRVPSRGQLPLRRSPRPGAVGEQTPRIERLAAAERRCGDVQVQDARKAVMSA